MNYYEKYMSRCIELARHGEGKASPNPLVGCIVLDKYDNVAGEGYHQKYGEAHAEVNALNKAGENVEGGTLFVNLEPCSHWGKTPPCVDLIIERGVSKVVIGMLDPNPKVDGINKLKEAGVEVITGVLESECEELNEIFIKNQKEQKPFIAIKTATTLDGKIATKTGSSKWITSQEAREEVHKLRNKYDAILTGAGTICADDPSLDCRMEGGRDPIKVVVDTYSRTLPESKAYQKGKIILATKEKTNKYPDNVEVLACPLGENAKINLESLIAQLYSKGVCSILVEAGGTLNSAFLREKLVDKVYHFIAPKILGDNLAKSFVEGFDVTNINNCEKVSIKDFKKVGNDVIIIYRLESESK